NIKLIQGGSRAVPADEFSQQLQHYLGKGELTLLVPPIPLGLPDQDSRETLCEFHHLPSDKLLSEKEAWARELEGKRKAETEGLLSGLREKAASARADLQAHLEALRPLYPYLDPARVEALRRRVERMVATEGLTEWNLEQRRQEIKTEIEGLAGELPAPEALAPLVDRLLQEFGELLVPPKALKLPAELEHTALLWNDPAGYYRALFSDPGVRANGWTPAQAAQYLHQIPHLKAMLESKLPAFPLLSAIVFSNQPHRRNSYDGFYLQGEPRRLLLYFNMARPDRASAAVLPLLPIWTLELLCEFVLMDDPAVSGPQGTAPSPAQASGELVAVPQEVFWDYKAPFDPWIRRALEGLPDHPWLEAPPFPSASDLLEDTTLQTLWSGGFSWSAQRWTALSPLIFRLAYLLGGEKVTEALWRDAGYGLDLIEKRKKGERSLASIQSLMVQEELQQVRRLARKRSLTVGRRIAPDEEAAGSVQALKSFQSAAYMGVGIVKKATAEKFHNLGLSDRWERNVGDLALLANVQALLGVVPGAPADLRPRAERLAEAILEEQRRFQSSFDYSEDFDSPFRRLVDGYAQMARGLRLKGGLEEALRRGPVRLEGFTAAAEGMLHPRVAPREWIEAGAVKPGVISYAVLLDGPSGLEEGVTVYDQVGIPEEARPIGVSVKPLPLTLDDALPILKVLSGRDVVFLRLDGPGNQITREAVFRISGHRPTIVQIASSAWPRAAAADIQRMILAAIRAAGLEEDGVLEVQGATIVLYEGQRVVLFTSA
ncbi:MAG: hypothetical protein HYS41_07420, partial [Candidatus Omnitrophica bacterium]|nr:hypothetical protein [Candidatus Omnitrophota bacterium]